MNKQALYLFSGALLASTALVTGAQAALVKANPGTGAADGRPATTAITAKGLATQVFSGTAATAGAVTISGTSLTAASSILIDYNSAFTSAFNIQLDVTGAEFSSGTVTLAHYYQSTSGGSLELLTGVTGCATQVLSDKVLIQGCDPTVALSGATTVSRVDAIGITGLVYTSAGALATASTSVSLSGLIRNSANTVTFENITSAAVITSKSAVDATVDAATALTVDNTASPAFTKLTGSASSANIGSVHFSGTSAVGTDLSTIFLANSLASTAEVKVTHGVLSDAALTEIRLVSTVTYTRTPAQFPSGTVSFTIPGGSLPGAIVQVQFTGTTAISAATGSATVTPTAGGTTVAAVGAFSGSLASISRGGLSIQLNTLLPTASTNYSSFIRLVNSSTVSGTATVSVSNDTTGVALGTYTTSTIAAGGTLTISSTDIETALAITSSASVNYKVTVAGAFNGYAQHLVYNKTSGVFSDFSGFRNGALTVDP